jgi:hypothetical protein
VAQTAGGADHVWSLKEWLSFSAIQYNEDTTKFS